jgi:hypothetical protein
LAMPCNAKFDLRSPDTDTRKNLRMVQKAILLKITKNYASSLASSTRSQ